jgi:hypothetical protein
MNHVLWATRELTEEIHVELTAAPSGKLTTTRFMRHWAGAAGLGGPGRLPVVRASLLLVPEQNRLNHANGRHHGYQTDEQPEVCGLVDSSRVRAADH